MDMYHITQLSNGGITTHEDADLLNDVGSMCAKGMATENTRLSPIPSL